ncbi:LysR substrate-binding domain-containing protein [Pseudohaliea sp.]|uniref:LysR substrate-binding domain-containing protein n=1 Tax=Pseudohaliea sp. TaxID=2740289 RepID=UPI0032EE36A6
MADLFFFREVAHHLSFSQAAQTLNLTQAAVSQRIRQLEEQLGRKLFHRHARGVSLTSLGKELFDAICEGFADVSRGTLKVLGEDRSVRIVVSCPPSFAMEWLVPRLASFYALQPDIQLAITAEYQAPTREQLQRSGTDLAIRYEPLFDHPELHTRDLQEELIFPIVAPSFMQQAGDTRKLAELISRSVLLHDAEAWAGAPQTHEWDCWLAEAGIALPSERKERFFNLANLAASAARQGEGIAMGRASMALEALHRNELLILGDTIAASGIWYRVISLHTLAATEPAASFIAWLEAEISKTYSAFEAFCEAGIRIERRTRPRKGR